MQPFEYQLFVGNVHDRAADSRWGILGQLNVSMVPIPVNGPVRKHSSKLVHIGAPHHQGLLPSCFGRGTILGGNGGIELRAADFHWMVPQSVYGCGASGKCDEIAPGVPGPCAKARSFFGQPDAFLSGSVTLLSGGFVSPRRRQALG